jgi:hypothetical protein
MRINKRWLRPLFVFADNVYRPPDEVIERALFEYWCKLIHQQPDSPEGKAAKHALDTVINTASVPKRS